MPNLLGLFGYYKLQLNITTMRISMLIYGNIRDLAYFTYKLDIIFGGHFDFFIKSVISVLY